MQDHRQDAGAGRFNTNTTTNTNTNSHHRPSRKQRFIMTRSDRARRKPELANKSHSSSSDNKFSRLIDNLSEFLAARHSDNRFDCYTKFCNAAETAPLAQRSPEQQVDNNATTAPSNSSSRWQPLQMVRSDNGSNANDNNDNLYRPYSMTAADANRHLLPAPAGHYFKTKQISKSSSATIRTYHHRRPARTKRRRVSSLLIALLDPRKQRLRQSRASLLISLFRAPIVLAALFSLALCISLIILYGLTYLQQHNALHSFHRFYHISPPHHCAGDETSAGNLHLQRQVDELFAGNNATTWTKRQAPAPTPAPASDSIVIQTECGSFEGRTRTVPQAIGKGQAGAGETQVAVFKGVPYASPPVGARRWTRPRPVWLDKEHLCKGRNASWRALDERPHCPQLSPFLRRYTGSEDCLYLDIYAPIIGRAENSAGRRSPTEEPPKLLPVMVYVHGGFLAYGSSGSGQVNWLNGARPSAALASELQVVLVAFNFRLQALGFMALSQLARDNGPDSTEGNYGLWDQLAALHWVRRNIRAFSGDPLNVVVFGPDSAAALPLALISRSVRGGQARSGELGAPVGRSLGGGDSDGRLFRGVWLANPTTYYPVSYLAANQHYQRLLSSQSSCYAEARLADAGGTGANDSAANASATSAGRRLRDCLMQLSAEQVVRQYLGKDDPAYRLDDENSLPIRGIFADQLVTVDDELVVDFAFSSSSSSASAKGADADRMSAAANSANKDSDTDAANANRRSHHGVDGANGTAQNAEQRNNVPAPAANEILSRRRVDRTADRKSRSSADEQQQQQQQEAIEGRHEPVELLVGSTMQAVEYWPCPSNVHRWNWDEFERYVGTSLNSFSRDAYKQTSSLYAFGAGAGANQNDSAAAAAAATETYLTMVSDIRQLCPAEELVAGLRALLGKGGSDGRVPVHRYVIETRPSARLAESLARRHLNGDQTAVQQQPQQQVKNQSAEPEQQIVDQPVRRYAFHQWDLLAFFGFDQDPALRPDDSDLRFQSQVRDMVRRFVHGSGAHLRPADSDSIERRWPFQSDGTLFTLGGATKPLPSSDFRRDTCAFWQRFLGRTYAWVS